MEKVININTTDQEIDLDIGRYKIDILGGWGVVMGQFSISLKHTLSGEIINCKRAFWPVQSYAFRKRAKRIFVVTIPERGTYRVEFMNSNTVRLKQPNLLFAGKLHSPIPNGEISIYIHK